MVNTIPSPSMLGGENQFTGNMRIFRHCLILIIHIYTQVQYFKYVLLFHECFKNILLGRLCLSLSSVVIYLYLLTPCISTLIIIRYISIWALLCHGDPPLHIIYPLVKGYMTKYHTHLIYTFVNLLLPPDQHFIIYTEALWGITSDTNFYVWAYLKVAVISDLTPFHRVFFDINFIFGFVFFLWMRSLPHYVTLNLFCQR